MIDDVFAVATNTKSMFSFELVFEVLIPLPKASLLQSTSSVSSKFECRLIFAYSSW